MIFGLCVLFLTLGLIMSNFDIFISYPAELYILIIMIRFLGLTFSIIGTIVLSIRIKSTNTSIWLDTPSSKYINLIHSHIRGKDPDAKFIRAKRLDAEMLRCKNKLFKDIGGGFRIAGHSCRRTYETICFTVPEWLSAYFHDIKEKYGLKNSDEFRELKTKLKNLKDPGTSGKTLEEQLKEIELLKPIMQDEEKKQKLLELGYDKIKNLEYTFYDGVTHNGDEVELLIDSATPNELDIIEKQTFLNAINRYNFYKEGFKGDFARYMPWLIMAVLVIAVVMMIIKAM